MAFDPEKRQALINHCNRFAESHDGELPAVTVEQFFNGNDDRASFMCNIDDDDFERIRGQVLAIRDHPEVTGVFVQVHEIMDEEEDSWPFAEQLLIVTKASVEQVRGWFIESLAPDDVSVLEDHREDIPEPGPGQRILIA